MAAKDIARVYASSLVELAQDKKILPEIEEEIGFLADLVKSDKDFRNFLVTPGITKDSKKDFVEKIFKGKLSDYIVYFLKVLLDNDRQAAIVEINDALVALVDQLNNRQKVTVITSTELDSSVKEKLASKLKQVMKKDIIMSEHIDASILGGVIIKVGDTVIDGSLAKDLKNIKNNLLNSKVRSEVAYED